MSSADNVERSPRVELASELRASAGASATAVLVLTNTADAPRVLSVTALGLDAAWLPRPSRSRTLAPGESIQVELTFRPAVGTVPAQYPLAVAVQALDPATSQATAPTAIAELVLAVDAPGTIALRLAPQEATGRFGKKLEVLVENSGMLPVSVELSAETAAGLTVALDRYRVEVPAGQTVPVPGRVSSRARLSGARVRRGYVIEARAGSAPRRVEGSYTSRALLASGAMRATALLALVAIWIAAAIVFIPKLADHAKSDRTATAAQAATSTGAAPTAGTGKTARSGRPGGSGSGGSGSGGSGSGGSGSGSGSKSGGASGSGSTNTPTVQLNGNVLGADASGVLVTMAASSPVDAVQAVETGTDSAGAAVLPRGFSATRETGKVSSEAVFTLAPSAVAQNRTTHSTADGAWTLPMVPVPGYYELTFSKPGYQTVRYLVDSSSAAATQPLNVSLVPGQGVLTGSVRGPGGAVGGASVTITDGTNTLSTSSNSKGKVGSWSVSGLSTPSTYLVTVSKDGLSTESTLVTLGAGGSASVSLTLKRGVASLVGQVQGSDNSGSHAGLGGASITVSTATLTRTVTTVTKGGVAGRYILPDLPAGVYTVTVAATGYQPQTTKLRIKPGQSTATLNVSLLSSSGSVIGRVTGSSSMAGAGLTLSNPYNTYKTTAISEPDGQFSFDGLAPGEYTLTASQFRYQTATVQVTVVAGQTTDLLANPIALSEIGVDGLPTTSQIDGQVTDAAGQSLTVQCLGTDGHVTDQCITATTTDPAFVTDTNPHGSVSSVIAPSGTYHLGTKDGAGLTPGLHTVTLTAPGYEPGQVKVSVPSGGLVVAPIGKLLPAPRLSGTINVSVGTPTGAACVYAVLKGSTVTPSCTKSGACPLGMDSSTVVCTPVMDPASTLEHPIVSANGTGSFDLEAPAEGTYTIYIKSADARYNIRPDAGGVAVEATGYYLRAGQTNEFDATLHRLGQLNLHVWVPDSGTTQVAAGAGISIFTSTAACSPTLPPSPDPAAAAATTNSLGAATIEGVNSALSVWASSGSSYDCIAAAVPPIDGGSNLDLHLTTVVPAMVGRLVTHRDGQILRVLGNVKATTVTSYSGGTGVTAHADLTTDGNGCFGIRSTSAITTTDPSCPSIKGETGSTAVWTITSPDKLRSAEITFSANVSGYLSLNRTVTMDADPAVNDIGLTAQPVGFAAEPVVAATTAPVWSAITTTVETCNDADKSGDCTGSEWQAAPSSVTATTPSGTLVWHDTAYGAGSTDAYQPGHYRVTIAAPGYQGSTAVIYCPVGGSCAIASGTLQLVHLGQITGTVNDVTASSSQPVNGALVTAVLCQPGTATPTADADGYYSCTASSTSYAAVAKTPTSGKFAITGSASTVPGIDQAGDWLLIVDAPGYCTGTPRASDGTCAHVPDSAVNAGDTVHGAAVATLTGDVPSGIDVSSADVAVSVLQQPTSVKVALVHKTGTAATDLAAIPGQSLTLSGGGLPTAIVGTEETDADGNGTGIYDFGLLDHGTYTVDYSGDQVVTGSGEVDVDFCTTDAACEVTGQVVATAATNSVTVNLTASRVGGTTSPLSGATVCILQAASGADTSKLLADTTCAADAINDVNGISPPTPTESGGAYLFTNVPSTPKHKSYYVRAEAPNNYGYQAQVSSGFVVKFSGPQAVTVPLTLPQVTRKVMATVTLPPGDDLTGSTWSLTSAGGTPSALVPTNSALTNVSGSGDASTYTVTFNQAAYGCWKLGYSLAGHFGTLSLDSSSPVKDTTLTCSSGAFLAGGRLVDDGTEVDVAYTLDEYEATVSVTADANGSGLTPPTTVSVTAKSGSTKLVDGKSVAVNQPAGTSVGWFDDDTTLALTAAVPDDPNDPTYAGAWALATPPTIDETNPSATLDFRVPMTTVKITAYDGAVSSTQPLSGASVTLDASGVTDTPDWYGDVTLPTPPDTNSSGTSTFKIPAGTGWNVIVSYANTGSTPTTVYFDRSTTFDTSGSSISPAGLVLYPQATVTLHVTNSAGDAASSANVSLTVPSGLSGYSSWLSIDDQSTDGSGDATFTVPYGASSSWSATVTPADTDYSVATKTFTVDASHLDSTVDVQAGRKTATVKVTVQRGGSNQTGATVKLVPPATVDDIAQSSLTPTSSSGGVYTFSADVPYASAWTITVTYSTGATTYDNGAGDNLDVHAASVSKTVTIAASP